MEIKKSTLAQRIKAARKRARLTQAQVAMHFEIDRSAVTMWESRNANVNTRPDVTKLHKFARLTKTPLWWLLRDDSDPDEAWPEVVDEDPREFDRAAKNWSEYLQDFWHSVKLTCKTQRSDLWDAGIWAPAGPAWMVPLVPDIGTERSIVQLVAAARPDFPKVAHAMAALVAFEKLQGRTYARKVVMVWRPHLIEDLAPQHHYVADLDKLLQRAEALGVELGVRYIEVRNKEEAAQYLLQIL